MLEDQLLGQLLIDLAVIVLVAHLAGILLRRIGQPAVLGEIFGGIVLGPTVLGAFPGDPSTALFPETVRPLLTAIGNVGLVIFMFLVGLELDLRALRRGRRATVGISAGAVALPFALGIGLAAVLHPSNDVVAGHRVDFLPFALFIATALSITAFPVLARILVDRGLRGTRVGELAMASAAVQDAVGWLLLTVALATLASADAGDLMRIALEGAAFVAVLVLAVRPLLRTWCARVQVSRPLGPELAVVALCGLVACAGTTQLIGLHAVLGAFAFGLVFPRPAGDPLVGRLSHVLAPTTMAVLLPVYFLSPGLSVDIGSVEAQAMWQFPLILVCACVGKVVGVAVPARLVGFGWREAGALGALLNTRGLIELIVLNVGLTRGILSQDLFSQLVFMAIATTLITGPALSKLGFGAQGATVPEPPPGPAPPTSTA